jgi:uncharacterized protein (UPF0333 family)
MVNLPCKNVWRYTCSSGSNRSGRQAGVVAAAAGAAAAAEQAIITTAPQSTTKIKTYVRIVGDQKSSSNSDSKK